MRRIRKRLLALACLAVVAILGIVAANLKIFNSGTSAIGETRVNLTKYFPTYAPGISGATREVGYFELNNERAYCIMHDKYSAGKNGINTMTLLDGPQNSFPMQITESSSETYQLIYKILYYGENGNIDYQGTLSGRWNGHDYTGTSVGYGRIPISVAASYVFTTKIRTGEDPSPTSSQWNSLNYRDEGRASDVNAKNLLSYASSQPLPKGTNWLYIYSQDGDNFTILDNGRIKAGKYQFLAQYKNEPLPDQTITLEKEWVDKNNVYGTRPESISYSVYVDGTLYNTYTLTGTGNTWTKEVTVPGGTVEVVEATLSNYKSTHPSTYKFKNIYESKTTSTVTKQWADFNNASGARPSSISLDLLQNGNVYKTITLSDDGDSTWTHTENDLREYDDDGNMYTYTWQESSVPSGYTMTQSGNVITNTSENVTSSTVTKVWKDNNNAYNTRPTSVNVQLLRNGTVIKTVTLQASSNWKHTENELERYDNNGNEYTYTWREPTTPAGYVASIKGNTITNTLTGTTSLTMGKVWIDNSNKYNTRPANVTFNILRNSAVLEQVTFTGDSNSWSYTKTGLDKYDENGKEYVYTISEASRPENYVLVSETNNVITNKLSAKTAVQGTKVWKDNSNAYNTRPETVTLNLFKTLDGETQKTKVEATPTWTKDGDEWTYSFDNLPLYEDGVLVNYSITEDAPANYKSKINGFDLVNTLTGKVEIKGLKIWKHHDAPESVRPVEVTVVLYRNGKEFKTLIVNGDDAQENETGEHDGTVVWSFKFTDLDKYDSEGKQYVYTIGELDVEFYDTTVDQYDIFNEYNPELIDIHLDAIWINDMEEDRPEKVEVLLICGDTDRVVDRVELVAENGWEHTWTEVDPNMHCRIEQNVQFPGYYPSVVTGDVEHGFRVITAKIPKNPKTLDNVKVASVILTASTAAGIAIISRKRR